MCSGWLGTNVALDSAARPGSRRARLNREERAPIGDRSSAQLFGWLNPEHRSFLFVSEQV
jgi:hypothetical protein